jgi:hypothetical protein
MAITLAQFRERARQRADMEESTFVTDSELTTYLNDSIAELHDLLIGAYNEEYYMESVEFTTVSQQLDYDLPDGTNYNAAAQFYKLRGVDSKINDNDWQTVKRFNFNRRNEDVNTPVARLAGLPYLEYRIVGSKIRFNRMPDAGTQIRLWYHPVAQTLSTDTDAFDDINGYADYVVVDAAIKMLNKEESDVTVLLAQKEALRTRIKEMAQNRDANEPESVSDIYAEDSDYYWLSRS